MKNYTEYMSCNAERMPLNQTLVIPVSKIQDNGIIDLPYHILIMMNIVVAIDYDVPCFYIIKNRWGMCEVKEMKTNLIPIQYLESFLLKPDVFTMDELYRNAKRI